MIKNGREKRVIITRPDGEELTFDSQSEAARKFPEVLAQSYISQMCRGIKESHNGFKARWWTPQPAPATETPADPQ